MEDDTFGFLMGSIFSIVLTSLIVSLAMATHGIDISQETGDDICKSLTGNESAVAEDSWDNGELNGGKLGCVMPTYDATHNIVFSLNTGEAVGN